MSVNGGGRVGNLSVLSKATSSNTCFLMSLSNRYRCTRAMIPSRSSLSDNLFLSSASVTSGTSVAFIHSLPGHTVNGASGFPPVPPTLSTTRYPRNHRRRIRVYTNPRHIAVDALHLSISSSTLPFGASMYPSNSINSSCFSAS